MKKELLNIFFILLASGICIAYYLEIKNRSYLDQKLIVIALVFGFLFMASIEIIRNLRSIFKYKNFLDNFRTPYLENVSREVFLALAILLYVFLIWFAGFLIATGLSLPLLMYILGTRKVLPLLLFPICWMFTIYILFVNILGVKFPSSVLSRIMQNLS